MVRCGQDPPLHIQKAHRQLHIQKTQFNKASLSVILLETPFALTFTLLQNPLNRMQSDLRADDKVWLSL